MIQESAKRVVSHFPEGFYDAFAYYLSGTFFWTFITVVLIKNPVTSSFVTSILSLNIQIDSVLKGYLLLFMSIAGAYCTGIVVNTASHYLIRVPFEWLKWIKVVSDTDLFLTSLIYPNASEGSMLLWISLRKREGIIKLSRNMGFSSLIAFLVSAILLELSLSIPFFIATFIFLLNYIARERWFSKRIIEAQSLGK